MQVGPEVQVRLLKKRVRSSLWAASKWKAVVNLGKLSRSCLNHECLCTVSPLVTIPSRVGSGKSGTQLAPHNSPRLPLTSRSRFLEWRTGRQNAHRKESCTFPFATGTPRQNWLTGWKPPFGRLPSEVPPTREDLPFQDRGWTLHVFGAPP